MKVATLARRPCQFEGVTQNVVQHACGALNIDATRIGAGDGDAREEEKTRDACYARSSRDFHVLPGPRGGDARGRWPANVILQHTTACERVGFVLEEGYAINRWNDGAKPFGGGAGHAYSSEKVSAQLVEQWRCGTRCAALSLGKQSGAQTASSEKTDSSRFFKQVQGMNDGIPSDLLDYLVLLISPPPSCVPLIIAEVDLGRVDFTQFKDESVHGLVTQGDPSPWLDEMHRVLRPGAHVLLLSDDEDPTGATGACAIEDFGYEVRDAIAILDTADEFIYSAKPSSRERHEGVAPRDRIVTETRMFPRSGENLQALREELTEVVEGEELERMETDGLLPSSLPEEILESFESREVELRRELRNDHATVKSVGLMSALLEGTPQGALVVDPFMGSGTTGIACVRAGYDFLGIERERDSLTISDQRVRHWDRKEFAWDDGVEILSEALPFEHESNPLGGIFDLMRED
jgi:hypothetical protein